MSLHITLPYQHALQRLKGCELSLGLHRIAKLQRIFHTFSSDVQDLLCSDLGRDSKVSAPLLQGRCKMWADAGECDANPGFMTNNCKVACKQCKLPLAKPTVKAAPKNVVPSSPSNLISKAADTVQQGAAVASDSVGKVVSTGKEAMSNLVTNVTSGSSQNQTAATLLQKAGRTTAVVSDEIRLAVQKAANASRADSEDDAPGEKRGYDDSQVACSICMLHFVLILRQSAG